MGAGASLDEKQKGVDIPPPPTTLSDEELRERLENNSIVIEEDIDEVEGADIISELRGDPPLSAYSFISLSLTRYPSQQGDPDLP